MALSWFGKRQWSQESVEVGTSKDEAEAKKVKLAEDVVAKKVANERAVQRRIQIVCDAIENARHLTNDCQTMLKGMIEGSLTAGCDERDDIQKGAVQTIGAIISKLEKEAVAKLTRTEAIVADPALMMSSMQSEVQQASADLSEADKDVQEKKTRLDDVRRGVSEAQKRQGLMKESYTDQLAAQRQLAQEKRDFEDAYVAHFAKLRDGLWDTRLDLEKHLHSLMPLFKKFDYEESLINAYRPAAQKKPDDRRAFDKIVVEQAERSFLEYTDDLGRKIQASEPGVEKARLAMEACQKAVSDARDNIQAAGLVLGRALVAKRNAQSLWQDAKNMLDEFPEDPQQARSERDAAKQSLEDFGQGTYEAFTFLRDRVAAAELVAHAGGGA